MGKEPDSVIQFSGCELSLHDVKETLRFYNRQQGMLIQAGKERQPDGTDLIAVPVMRDGAVENGWTLGEVRGNVRRSIGVTELTLNGPEISVKLRYVAHEEALSIMPYVPPLSVMP